MRIVPPAMLEKFFALVKEFPVIYDHFHANHRCKDTLKRVWKLIAIRMDCDEIEDEEWKIKWKTQRDMYVKKRREIRNCRNASEAARVKKYRYAKALSFLDPYLFSEVGIPPEKHLSDDLTAELVNISDELPAVVVTPEESDSSASTLLTPIQPKKEFMEAVELSAITTIDTPPSLALAAAAAEATAITNGGGAGGGDEGEDAAISVTLPESDGCFTIDTKELPDGHHLNYTNTTTTTNRTHTTVPRAVGGAAAPTSRRRTRSATNTPITINPNPPPQSHKRRRLSVASSTSNTDTADLLVPPTRTLEQSFSELAHTHCTMLRDTRQHPVDLFFMSAAMRVKKMPAEKQAWIQMQLSTLLYNAETSETPPSNWMS